jgi:hypothetical protein
MIFNAHPTKLLEESFSQTTTIERNRFFDNLSAVRYIKLL